MGGSASKQTSPVSTRKKSINTPVSPTTGFNGSARTELQYYIKIMNHPSPSIRLDHCDEPITIKIKGCQYDYNLKYVYVSQRGYYPDDPNKANQDSYLICEKLLGDNACNMFGIFDGHGSDGDKCSYFAADELPDSLVKILNKKGGGLTNLDTGSKMHEIYSKAFLDTNKLLRNSNVEDTLSGTTAVTILQKGDKLLVANVGDSRAIIASVNPYGELIYSPLSSDQTPYRKDERERLKKAGARIMTIDQIEGNEPLHENFGTELGNEIDEGGDPPRVWDSSLSQPGCAFSRSIGDNVAKAVGVTAEPEILEWDIKPNDKFAIVASDGVFEFITSQSVVDMIAKYNDPIEAAKQVVAEAYRLWLTFDERTDDITIIVIFFENIHPSAESMDNGSPRLIPVLQKNPSFTALQSSTLAKENKPIRKIMSKQRRVDIQEQFEAEVNEEIFDFDKLIDTKSITDKDRINKMLENNFMFQNLSNEQKLKVIKAMVVKEVKAKDMIIYEGDQGNEMYIIDQGEFIVLKKDEQGVNQTVFIYSIEGGTFGELSLLYGKPRAASIQAKTDGRVWCIGRAAYRAVTVSKSNKHQRGLIEIFLSVPIIADLTIPAIHRMCLLCKEYTYEKNDVIVNEQTMDQIEWSFAIITSGMVRLFAKEEGKKRQLRDASMFFSIDEMGSKFTEAKADTLVKLVCVTKEILSNALTPGIFLKFQDTMNNKKNKGKRRGSLAITLTPSNTPVEDTAQAPSLGVVTLVFNDPEYYKLLKITSISNYQYSNAVAILGSFGFVGNFNDKDNQNNMKTVKVLVKSQCILTKMEERLLKERNILAAITNKLQLNAINKSQSYCLVSILGSYVDTKWVYITYRDHFICDISLVFSAHILTLEMKLHFMALIYTGLCALHELGLIHRFVNSSSIYITSQGIPKLVDFRYAKCMDGSLSYTICGDPLYFAPEIISSKGYDYGSDLWSLGILFYEMYEDNLPFGNIETEETALYNKISLYTNPDSLVFDKEKTPSNIQSLIKQLLNPVYYLRAGYMDKKFIQTSACFQGIDWTKLNDLPAMQIDIEPSINAHHFLDDSMIKASTQKDSFFSKF